MTAARERPAAATNPGIRLAYSIPVPLGQSGSAQVEIRVSDRRRKSCQAHLEAGKVVVVVPAAMSSAAREEVAARLALRLLDQTRRRGVASDEELERRAHLLADRYLGGVRATSVRFVTNQARRWGSCTPASGTIRVSSRLRNMPEWVLDAVLVHELAHLLECSHSELFTELCSRYPRRAEADAYLLGFEHGASTAVMPLGPVPAEPWGIDGRAAVDGDVELGRQLRFG